MKQALLERFRVQKPFDDMEVVLVNDMVERPGRLPLAERVVLRYALNFARLSVLRGPKGREVNVFDEIHGFRLWLRDALEPLLSGPEIHFDFLLKAVPTVKARLHQARAALLRNHVNDFSLEDLDDELCHKVLAVVSGGGGGSGYVYLGAFQAIEEAQLTPRLVVGTSMGSIIGLLRCRYEHFDLQRISEITTRLRWSRMFAASDFKSTYGLPGALRLHLHDSLAPYYWHEEEDRPLRLNELPVPFECLVAGLKADELDANVDDYERSMGRVFRRRGGRSRGGGIFGSLLRAGTDAILDFAANPSVLREIILGHDRETATFDALDCAGFSSAVPGAIHYELDRDDPYMTGKLDALFAEYRVAALMDGGVINNVPARAAWESIQRGRCGRRNAVIVAMDCFAPKPWLSPIWVPLQRLAQENVRRNRPFAQLHKSFRYTLSPLDLVPDVKGLRKAVEWGVHEIGVELIPQLIAMMETLPGLELEYIQRPWAAARTDVSTRWGG